MALIGEIFVNLRAGTAAFASDLKRASNLSFDTARQMERSFKIIGAAAVGAIGAAAAGAAAMAARAIDTADKMGKMAQSTGMSVEQFSALSYAARLSDIDTGALSQSLVILAKNLEKSNQATLEGKAAHSALGTLFRGNIPVFASTQGAMEGIAERLSKLPDGYQKSALAAQIFGKSGAQLIPLLNQGAEGIRTAAEEAAAFGVVVSGQTAKAAEHLNDQMTRLKAAVDGVGMRLAEALLPYLTRLADYMVENAKSASAMSDTLLVLKTSVQVVATAVVGLAGILNVAGNALGAFLTGANLAIQTLNPFASNFEVERDWAQFRASLGLTADAAGGLGTALSAIWQEPAQKARTFAEIMDAAVAAAHSKIPPPASDEKAIAAGQKAIEGLRLQIELYGKTVAEATKIKALAEGHSLAQAKIEASLAGQLELMKQAAGAMPKPRPLAPQFGPPMPPPQIAGAMPEIDMTMWEKLGPLVRESKARLDELRPVVIQVREDLSQMFTRAIFRAEGFRDALGNLLARIAEMIFQLGVMEPLMNRLFGAGGKSGGGILSTIIGGIAGLFAGGVTSFDNLWSPTNPGGVLPMAAGGFASAGTPLLVGESGPEIFTPSSNGSIIPNRALGGTSITVINNIDARGADPGAEQRIRRALKESEDRTMMRTIAVMDQRNRRTA